MRDLLDVNRHPGHSRVAPSGLTTMPDDGFYQGRGTFIPILLEIIWGVARVPAFFFTSPGISVDQTLSTQCTSHNTHETLRSLKWINPL